MQRLIIVFGLAFLYSVVGLSQSPSATEVNITEEKAAGHILTGHYTFNQDPVDLDLEGISTFKWYRAVDIVGTGALEISAGTSINYTIQSVDVGKYICFEVTPIDAQLHLGIPVRSSYLLISNDLPEGLLPNITGTKQVGYSVTAIASYTDSENDPQGVSTFQWYRSTGTVKNGIYEAISGETTNSYPITAGDMNKFLFLSYVPVATSGASPGLTARSDTFQIINLAPVGTLTNIAGVRQVGGTVSSTKGYVDNESDPEGASTYQWYRSTTTSKTGTYEAISGAQTLSHLLTIAEKDRYVFLSYTPIATSGTTPGTTVRSDTVQIQNLAPVGTLTNITGVRQVGGTISSTRGYSDNESDPEGASTYQWYRSTTTAKTGTYEAISGAQTLSHLLTIAEKDRYVFLSYTPIATSGTTPGTTVRSDTVQIQNLAPVGTLTNIAGVRQVGGTVSSTRGYSDSESDPEGASTYQWYRSTTTAKTGTYEAISGAQTLSHLLTIAEKDRYVFLSYTPIATSGTTPGTTVRSDTVQIQNLAPVGTLTNIAGVRQVGGTVSSTRGYSDNESDPEGASTYQWYRSTTTAKTGTYEAISGAQTLSHLLTIAEKDRYVFLSYTPIATSGTTPGTTVRSDTVQVLNLAPVGTLTNIAGVRQVGGTVSSTRGYSDNESDPEGASTYQWYRSTTTAKTGTYEAISGAQTLSHLLTIAEKDRYVFLSYTPIATSGTTPGTTVRSDTVQIQNLAPVGTLTNIAGVRQVGGTVSSTRGYSDNESDPEGASTYQWYRSTTTSKTGTYEAISGAQTLSHLLTIAEKDRYVFLSYTPIATSGTTPGTTVRSDTVQIQNLAPVGTLTNITGVRQVGGTISSTKGYSDNESDPEGASTYQWYRSTTTAKTGTYEAISGAQTLSHLLTIAEKDRYVFLSYTPIATSGTTPGTTVRSDTVQIQNLAPVGTLTNIAGVRQVGGTVSSTRGYSDSESDPEGASTYQWYRSTTTAKTGTYEAISGAQTLSHLLTIAEKDRYVFLSYTPIATSGTTPGTTVRSDTVQIQNLAPVGTLTNIAGVRQVGGTVSSTRGYSDNESDPEGASTYQWYRSTTTAKTGTYEAISGAQTLSHLLTIAEKDRYVFLSYTPIATSGTTPGTTVRSDTVQVLNLAPVGTLTNIAGVRQVGGTVSSTRGYSDNESDPEGASTYQWYRSTTTSKTGTYEAISGAQTLSHLLTIAEKDRYVFLSYTPIATSGTTPGTTVRSDTVQIQNLAPVGTLTNIAGVRQVGGTVSSTRGYSDNESDPEGASTYQWYRSTTTAKTGTYEAISGAQTLSHLLTIAEKDRYVFLSYTPIATSGTTPGTTVRSDTVQIQNLAPVGTLTNIAGVRQVGGTISSTKGYSDNESDPEGASTYQWYRSTTTAKTGTYEAISGAQTLSHLLTIAEKDRYVFLSYTPIATSGTTPGTTVRSDTVQLQNLAPVATITSISGTPQINQTLTVNYTVADNELDATGVIFQWSRSATSGGTYTPISGATGVTYTIVFADKEQYLKVEVTPTAATGTTPGALVSSTIQILNAPPVASNVDISGTNIYNSSVQTTYSYSDVDQDNQGATIYKWYISSTRTSGYSQIVSATQASYLIKLVDVSKYIFCEVTPVALSGTLLGTAKHSDTIYIQNQAPVASSLYISGNLEYGSIIRGKYTYTDLENDLESSSLYKWYRANSSTGSGKTLIVGANMENYVVQMADMNQYLSFEVTPAASSGTTLGVTVESLFVGPVLNTPPKATNIQIIGTQAVCKVLTGQYIYYDIEGNPEGYTTFRWLRANTFNGVKTPIPDATEITYKLTTDDQGKYIFFEVTPRATSGEINGFPYLSNPTGAILNLLPTVTFSGGTSICQGQITYLSLTFSGSPPFLLNYTNGTENFTLSSPSYFYNLPVTAGGTYKADSLKDNLGCTITHLTSQTSVVVNPLPVVSIVGLNEAYSLYGSPVPLTGNPSGGTFSGPGVVQSTNTFYPNIAGVTNSPHAIVYTYSAPVTGCTSAATVWVSVLDVDASIRGIRDLAKYCTFDPAFLITGVNKKGVIGTFTINGGLGLTDHGNNTATINPLLLAPGQYTISYSYLDNVIQTITKVITIEQLERARILNIPDLNYCRNKQAVKLTGNYTSGFFVGSGIAQYNNDYYFNPSQAPIGNDKIYYNYLTNYGCKLTDSVVFTVYSLPRVQFEVENRCWNNDSTVFINLSEPLDSITSWAWNFGDNSVPDSKNKSSKFEPKHLYASVGDKNISLIAQNIIGCKDTITKMVHLGDIPVVNFTWNKECFVVNQSIGFTNKTTSVDPITSYLWTVNDTSQNPILLATKNISLIFPRASGYNINLKAISSSGCKDSIKKTLYLRPVHFIKDSVYNNNFENLSNKWYTYANPEANWIWDHPGGSVINGSHSGNKAYYTSIPVTRNNQIIEVSSQCFDFTGVKKPFIEMWINSNTEVAKEGAVLQYTWDDSIKWVTMGNIGTGVNWYKDNSIAAFPTSPRLGWSGNSNGWVQARHNLDSLKEQKNVKFRILYGVNATSLFKDGFAFDDVFIGQRAKSVLFEHFTNESDASSILANTELYKIMDLAGVDAYSIQYHTSFPGVDTINYRNQQDPATRVLYYGVGAVPSCRLDGGFETKYIYDFNGKSPNINDVNIRALKDPDFDLEIVATYTIPNISGDVKIKALNDISGRNVSLYIAVVEDVEIQHGATKILYYNVLKKFLPSASGTLLKTNWTNHEVYTVNFSWNSQYIYNSEKVKIIAYLQDEQTREVYQVKMFKTTPLVSIRPILVNNESLIARFYPNPVSTTGTLVFNKAVTKDLTLRIIDKNGKICRVIKLEKGIGEYIADFTDYPNGLYFLQIAGQSMLPENVKVMVVH